MNIEAEFGELFTKSEIQASSSGVLETLSQVICLIPQVTQ
jgi:hypothetical protein